MPRILPHTPRETPLFEGYRLLPYDGMFESDGQPCPHYNPLLDRLIELGPDELARRERLADLSMRQQGITFTVYARESGVERIIPFDPIPRLIDAIARTPAAPRKAWVPKPEARSIASTSISPDNASKNDSRPAPPPSTPQSNSRVSSSTGSCTALCPATRSIISPSSDAISNAPTSWAGSSTPNASGSCRSRPIPTTPCKSCAGPDS